MASKATSRERMYLKMVVSSLVRRSSRLIVAVLAIAIGATTLSGLVTIYYDIPRQLGREFRSYGANLVLLPRGDTKILRRDLEEVRRIIGGDRIVGMAPYRYQTVKINEQPYIIANTRAMTTTARTQTKTMNALIRPETRFRPDDIVLTNFLLNRA